MFSEARRHMCRFISIALEGTAGFSTIGPGAPWFLAQINQTRPRPFRQCSMRPRCSLEAPPSCASIFTRSTGGPILANSAYIPDRASILLRQTGLTLNSGISGWPRCPRHDLRPNASFWDDRSNDDGQLAAQFRSPPWAAFRQTSLFGQRDGYRRGANLYVRKIGRAHV